MNTVGDLQGGIEVAERLLGYKVILVEEGTSGPLNFRTVSVKVCGPGRLPSPMATVSLPSPAGGRWPFRFSNRGTPDCQHPVGAQRSDLLQLRDDLADLVGRHRARGVIVDVTALDVLDSFATRTLRAIAHTTKLRGAETVIVGIQPDVALAMVQLGLTLEGVPTALDLEEGLAFLDRRTDMPVMATEVRVRIQSSADIVTARHEGRNMAATLGFSSTNLTIIATAISEVARNIVEYAKEGEITIALVGNGIAKGVKIIARDQGPGIADLETAMRDGYSTSRSLGLGLPGAKRLMDEFEICSRVGQGTTITMKKWIG